MPESEPPAKPQACFGEPLKGAGTSGTFVGGPFKTNGPRINTDRVITLAAGRAWCGNKSSPSQRKIRVRPCSSVGHCRAESGRRPPPWSCLPTTGAIVVPAELPESRSDCGRPSSQADQPAPHAPCTDTGCDHIRPRIRWYQSPDQHSFEHLRIAEFLCQPWERDLMEHF